MSHAFSILKFWLLNGEGLKCICNVKKTYTLNDVKDSIHPTSNTKLMVYLTVILLIVLDTTTNKMMNQICTYASNKELAAMVAVQQRQTLIM